MKVKELLDTMEKYQEVEIGNSCIYSAEVSGNVKSMMEMLSERVLNAHVKSVSIDDDDVVIHYTEEDAQ